MKEIDVSKENLHVGEYLFKEKEYWLDKLSGEFVISSFPYDYQDNGSAGHHIGSIDYTFDENVFSRLMQLRNESDPRLHMIFVAVTGILIHLYTGVNDIILGTTIDKQGLEKNYVNTILPLRNQTRDHMTFKQFLLQVRDTVVGALENQNYPVEELLDQLMINEGENRSLFDTAVLLENLQDRKYLRHLQPAILFSFNRTAESICMEVEYKASLYKKDTIERILNHFKRLLEIVMFDIDTRLSSIDILSPREKQQLIVEFNDTAHDYPDQKAVHELFESRAAKNPGAAALIPDDSGREVSYGELNTKANRLAKLLKTRGVKKETIVGIILHPSPEAVIGILGILKTGGTYLPIDPAFPLQRIRYILEDSKVMATLTIQAHARKIISPHPLILLDDENIPGQDGDNPGIGCDLANAAYIIYTSGTTGNPKGVLIQHGSLVNYIRWAARQYVQNEKANFPLYSSIAFDLTVTSIFTPLITGNSIVVYQGEDREFLVEKIFNGNKATVVKVTPVHLMIMSNRKEKEPTIRRFIVGGEKLETQLAQNIHDNFNGRVEIYNEYGPTEAAVGCMIYRYNPQTDTGGSVPIGRPADNVQIHLLNQYMREVPPGGTGEIYIGGDALARGYLNNPELTAEKFIIAPITLYRSYMSYRTNIIYKTGDLARRLPDSNIQFIGRKDQQVKIRGYRIETDEVENILLKHRQIRQTVVLAKDNKNGYKYLAAYVVPAAPGIDDKEKINPEPGQLRDYLSGHLPEFMIPSYFVYLDKLPTAPNGKVDRKSLAALDQNQEEMEENYCPPNSELEKIMVDVWQDVMKIDRVGITDSYFSMGGDSIKAIQISARLMNYGLKLEIGDLFQYPFIRELAPHLKPVQQVINQGIVEGEVKLTPIQKWFFQQNLTEMHHFNQSGMLHRPEGFDRGILEKTFQKLVEHHDALRMVFKREDGKIRQINRGLSQGFVDIEVFDLTGENDYKRLVREECGRVQASIDLSAGPLVKLGLFKSMDGDYLLIAIHHLVMDTVSWQILSEDFTSLYQQIENGVETGKLEIPLKSTSYKEWAEKLYEYASSEKILEELEYWQKIENIKPIIYPGNKEKIKGKNKDNRQMAFTITTEYTEKLLKQVNRAYNTEINDILLAALAMAVNHWNGARDIPLIMEGHGREEIIPGIDITRTVGWFTSLYPVVLKIKNSEDVASVIKDNKEMLRNIPYKGIGYGILRYLTSRENMQDIQLSLNPGIGFNYLGQFDEDTNNESFRAADILPGNSASLNNERIYPLYVSGGVSGGKLSISATYDNGSFKENEIRLFLDSFERSLLKIIDHCTAKKETELTLNDYSAPIDEQEIGQVFDVLSGITLED